MDPSRIAFARYVESKISAVLAWLPARHRRAALDPETLTLLRGIAWWMASCILAWLSLESTRKMTLIEYRNSYRPPRAAWEALLRSNGYRPVAKEGSAPPRGSFRVSADLTRVLLPYGEAPVASGRLWQRSFDKMASFAGSESGESGKEWVERPYTLQGLEDWISELDSRSKQPVAAERSHRAKRGNSIDPREIRY